MNGRAVACIAIALAMLLAAHSGGEQLPPEIQVDRLLVQAEREARDGDHGSAVVTLERTLELYEEHGLDVPSGFWFRKAGAFRDAGMHERAIEASTRYLREAGRQGEHYEAALALLDSAEVGLAEERKEEARARAAAERAEREAAARAAAIAASVPETVAIPGATFRMGCLTRRRCEKDEKPVRDVRVAAFALAKYELTFAQWDVCVEYGPCRWVPDEGWGRGDRPVVNVSWHDAKTYVDWLSQESGDAYRLPSEAEWEYAARAGTETRYSWGDVVGRNRANCKGCGSLWDDRRTAPVGSFAANPFGLYDMHGNVSEWVQDCRGSDYATAPATARAHTGGSCSWRILRGGSWGSSARGLRSAGRGSALATTPAKWRGFRIAQTHSR